ncbi:GtrA family protein [Pedobacter borealis]|uniref:GtrA family protein n=1 Tax=Pedobacter borealis TaxID=475254 RepID=UPI0004939CBF|nr:GtrA family protein [Pedobacter borealis]
MRKIILAVIDFFHPPFKKFISLHNFRYLATGGATLLLGILSYYFAYFFIFKTEEVDFGIIVLQRETASLLVDYAVAIPTSFLLNKYIIFTHSELKGRVQLFRFLNLQFINILANYVLLKFLLELLRDYPTLAMLSRILVSVLMALFSYLYQHYFTFSVKKIGSKKEEKKH